MMRRSELDHPFYRPLWRRVAMVAVALAWTLWEAFVIRDMTWALLSGALTAYGAWVFLITFPKPDDQKSSDQEPS
jgi:hypothetical protein